MCRLSRKVQDSYCSVQNVQDKQALYKGAASQNLYSASRRRAKYKIEGEKPGLMVNYSRHSEILNFRKNSKSTSFSFENSDFTVFKHFSKIHCAIFGFRS